MRLKDKVTVITGGGSGIGRESALLFASEGALIVAADVNEQHGADGLHIRRGRDGVPIRPVSRNRGCRLL